MNNEDYLIAFAGMLDRLEKNKKVSIVPTASYTIYKTSLAARKERWAKPIKTPKHITKKLADAREQRKEQETS